MLKYHLADKPIVHWITSTETKPVFRAVLERRGRLCSLGCSEKVVLGLEPAGAGEVVHRCLNN